jgi:hypothetical protein
LEAELEQEEGLLGGSGSGAKKVHFPKKVILY